MAVTLIDTEPVQIGPEVSGVFEYEISLDGASGVQTVRTPSVATNKLWVVGIHLSENNAGNVILKSGSSKTHTYELAANQGIYDKVERGYSFSTKAGEALTIDSTMAITCIRVRVAECAVFRV